MRLIVDANTLVAEGLRRRGRLLLSHSALDLVVAEEAWNETEHELRKRVTHLVAHGHLEQGSATLLDEVMAMLVTRVALAPQADLSRSSGRRTPADPTRSC